MPYQIPTTHEPSFAQLASSLVGFVRLQADGTALLCGSGTLIRIGDVEGILTAAHVVDALRTGELGLLLFTRPNAINRFKVTVQRDDLVVADGWDATTCTGPDLGFVRITNPERVAALKAYGCLFTDLVGKPARSLDRSAKQNNCLCGVVNATRVDGRNGDFDRTGFTAMLSPVRYRETRADNRLLIVEPVFGALTPPDTYQGVSGGALWTFQDGDYPAEARLILGVASREEKDGVGDVGAIVLETVVSIGNFLLPAMQRRYDRP